MATAINNSLALMLLACCAINVLGSIGDIAFPEADVDDPTKHNAENKLPLFVPTQCNENEYLYPGDHKNDYVCDCKPGYIYYPKTSRCYSPYRQGPCQPSQFLTIAPGQYIPECSPNRCIMDGLVTFRRNCYFLDQAGPCELTELSFVVAINTTTLDLECIQQNPDLSSRFQDDDDDQKEQIVDTTKYGTTCLRGSRRAIEGKC